MSDTVKYGKPFFAKLDTLGIEIMPLHCMEFSSYKQDANDFYSMLCERRVSNKDYHIDKLFPETCLVGIQKSADKSCRYYFVVFRGNTGQNKPKETQKSRSNPDSIQDLAQNFIQEYFNFATQADIGRVFEEKCHGVMLFGISKKGKPTPISACVFDVTVDGIIIHYVVTSNQALNKNFWGNFPDKFRDKHWEGNQFAANMIAQAQNVATGRFKISQNKKIPSIFLTVVRDYRNLHTNFYEKIGFQEIPYTDWPKRIQNCQVYLGDTYSYYVCRDILSNMLPKGPKPPSNRQNKDGDTSSSTQTLPANSTNESNAPKDSTKTPSEHQPMSTDAVTTTSVEEDQSSKRVSFAADVSIESQENQPSKTASAAPPKDATKLPPEGAPAAPSPADTPPIQSQKNQASKIAPALPGDTTKLPPEGAPASTPAAAPPSKQSKEKQASKIASTHSKDSTKLPTEGVPVSPPPAAPPSIPSQTNQASKIASAFSNDSTKLLTEGASASTPAGPTTSRPNQKNPPAPPKDATKLPTEGAPAAQPPAAAAPIQTWEDLSSKIASTAQKDATKLPSKVSPAATVLVATPSIPSEKNIAPKTAPDPSKDATKLPPEGAPDSPSAAATPSISSQETRTPTKDKTTSPPENAPVPPDAAVPATPSAAASVTIETATVITQSQQPPDVATTSQTSKQKTYAVNVKVQTNDHQEKMRQLKFCQPCNEETTISTTETLLDRIYAGSLHIYPESDIPTEPPAVSDNAPMLPMYCITPADEIEEVMKVREVELPSGTTVSKQKKMHLHDFI